MEKRVLSILVDNTSGVLSRVSGLFSRRGYSIDSLTVGKTENQEFSRMTVVVCGEDQVLEQIYRLAHCVYGVREGEEEIDLAEYIRQDLDRVGAGGACDLHDDDDYHDRLADIAERQRQRIDHRREGKARYCRRHPEHDRLLTLAAEQIYIAQNDYRGLYLSEDEEQEELAPVFLAFGHVAQTLRLGLDLEYRGEDNAADPDGQRGIERRHCIAVACDGIDGLLRHAHRRGEKLRVFFRVAVEDGYERLEPLVGRTLVYLDEKLVAGVCNAGHKRLEPCHCRGDVRKRIACRLDNGRDIVKRYAETRDERAHHVQRAREVREHHVDAGFKLVCYHRAHERDRVGARAGDVRRILDEARVVIKQVELVLHLLCALDERVKRVCNVCRSAQRAVFRKDGAQRFKMRLELGRRVFRVIDHLIV